MTTTRRTFLLTALAFCAGAADTPPRRLEPWEPIDPTFTGCEGG